MKAMTLPAGILPGTFVVIPMLVGVARWLLTACSAAVTPGAVAADEVAAADAAGVVFEFVPPPEEPHPAAVAASATVASATSADLIGTAIFLAPILSGCTAAVGVGNRGVRVLSARHGQPAHRTGSPPPRSAWP